MTISKEHRNGPFIVQCDECMDAEELEGEEFKEAVSDAKERGYQAHFSGGWTHSCKQCS